MSRRHPLDVWQPGAARRLACWLRHDTVVLVEPSHPVDPLASQAPAIPQARRSGEPYDEPPLEFGVEVLAADSPGDEEDSSEEHATEPRTPGDTHASQREHAQPLPAVWTRRSILLIVLAVVMALGAGGMGAFYVLYNRAAEPDRTSPGVVVRKYVEATFNDRDPVAAERYMCRSPHIAEADAMLKELVNREQAFNTRFVINSGNFRVQISGKAATVDVDLEVRTAMSSSIRYWRFALVQQSGWRVCEGHRIG